MKHKVLLVGAGSIGATKPDKFDSPTTEHALTHAHAIFSDPHFELSGIVDTDAEKGLAAAMKWGTGYTGDLSNGIRNTEPDVIVVSVPTKWHYETLLTIINHEHLPKLVICEKPFCQFYGTGVRIIEQFEEAGITLMVNYSRRFSISFQGIAKSIREGDLGKAQAAYLVYERGMKRDASHAIDLFNWFFDNSYTEGKRLGNHSIHDFSKEDPTVSAYLSYEKCPAVHLIPVDGRNFCVFDLTIFMEKGVIYIKKYGKDVYGAEVVPEPTYGNYNTLDTPKLIGHTDIEENLFNLYKNVHEVLVGEADPISPASGAVEVNRILEDLASWE